MNSEYQLTIYIHSETFVRATNVTSLHQSTTTIHNDHPKRPRANQLEFISLKNLANKRGVLKLEARIRTRGLACEITRPTFVKKRFAESLGRWSKKTRD